MIRASLPSLLLLSAFVASACATNNVTVIRDVTLIDVRAQREIPNQTIVIRGRTIAEVGATTKQRGRMIDGRGRYALPGLIDLHVHLAYAGDEALQRFTENGVTTVRDLGTRLAVVARMRRVPGAPRIIAAGSLLESGTFADHVARIEPLIAERGVPPLPPEVAAEGKPIVVRTRDEARNAVTALARGGAQWIKFRHVESRDTFLEIAEAAHASRLLLAGHYTGETVDLLTAATAGQRSFEHMYWLTSAFPSDETIRAFKISGAAIVPAMTSEWLRLRDDAWSRTEIDRRAAEVSPRLLSSWRRDLRISEEQHKIEPADDANSFAQNARVIRALHRAGIPILVGTDVGAMLVVPGTSVHRELAHLVNDAGFTPMEAIRAATIEAASLLGVDTGEIAAGRAADIVILNRSPLERIENIATIELVIADGVLLRGDDRLAGSVPMPSK